MKQRFTAATTVMSPFALSSRLLVFRATEFRVCTLGFGGNLKDVASGTSSSER